MYITCNPGERATLIGVRGSEMVTYFIDGEVVAQASIDELSYAATRAQCASPVTNSRLQD